MQTGNALNGNRNGDDFILVDPDLGRLRAHRAKTIRFLEENLKLSVNPKSDRILKVRQGLKFLGVVNHPNGRKLNRRNRHRISRRLSIRNAGSYHGILQKHAHQGMSAEFGWLLLPDNPS